MSVTYRGSVYEEEVSQKKMKWLNFLKILVFEFFLDKQVDEKPVNSIFTQIYPLFFMLGNYKKYRLKKHWGSLKFCFLNPHLSL